MRASAKTQDDVLAVVNGFMEAYQSRNLNAIMSFFATDDDTVIIGTGVDERRVGTAQIQAQVERDWAQSDSLALNMRWHQVSAAGTAAWVMAEVEFQGSAGGHEFAIPGRLTVVLEKRGGMWLIMHMHFSAPLAGQAAGASFPTE